MLPGVLLLAGIVFQNESPRWLVEKNRISDAAKALSTVRSKSVNDKDVAQELDEIVTDFQGHEKLSLKAQLRAACSSKRMFYQTSFAVILMFWQQWTGTNSINYYAPQIFQSIGLKGTSAGLFATGVYGIVKIVMTAIGLMAFTEQMGRKVCNATSSYFLSTRVKLGHHTLPILTGYVDGAPRWSDEAKGIGQALVATIVFVRLDDRRPTEPGNIWQHLATCGTPSGLHFSPFSSSYMHTDVL